MLNEFGRKLLRDNPAFKHYSAYMSSLLDVLGWTAPIIQAPMAGVQKPPPDRCRLPGWGAGLFAGRHAQHQ
jgi:hypothetical protein